ncbi:MAG TPA: hypothetical protein VG916_02380, partial [Gemmatimonadaceae bacterium]|nr:hypothetical protein [Gemmatimonadaceae bacterium]
NPATGHSTQAIWPSATTHGWCVSVVRLGPVGARQGVSWVPRQPLFDACGFHYAFGQPSAELHAVLARLSYETARAYRFALDDSIRRRAGRVEWDADLDAYACTRGSDSACVAYGKSLVGAGPRSESPVGHYVLGGALATTSVRAGTATSPSRMDRIALELGPARFREFWTHTGERGPGGPGDAAFADFGRPAAAEAMRGERGDRRFGVAPPEPAGTQAADVVLTLLAVAILAACATRLTVRPTAA